MNRKLHALGLLVQTLIGCSYDETSGTPFDPPIPDSPGSDAGDGGIESAGSGGFGGDGGSGSGGAGGHGGSGGSTANSCKQDVDCTYPDDGECFAPVCEYGLCVSRPVGDGLPCGAPPGFTGACKSGGCTYTPIVPSQCDSGAKACTGWWECSVPPEWQGCGSPICDAGCCSVLPC